MFMQCSSAKPSNIGSSIIRSSNRSSIVDLFLQTQISIYFNEYFYLSISRSAFDIQLQKVLYHELPSYLNRFMDGNRNISILLVEFDNKSYEQLRTSIVQQLQYSPQISRHNESNYNVDRMYDFFEGTDQANFVRSCTPFYRDEVKNYIFYLIGRCQTQQLMTYNPDLLMNLNIRTNDDSSIQNKFKSYFVTKRSKDQFTQQLMSPQSCKVSLYYFHERMKCIEKILSKQFISQITAQIKQYHDIDKTLEILQNSPKKSNIYAKLKSQVKAIIYIKDLFSGARFHPEQTDGLFEFKNFIQLESSFKELEIFLNENIIEINGKNKIQFNQFVNENYGHLKQKKHQYKSEVDQIVDKFNHDQFLKHYRMRRVRWGQEYCFVIAMSQQRAQDIRQYQNLFIEIQRIVKMVNNEVQIFVTNDELMFINDKYKDVNQLYEKEMALILQNIRQRVKVYQESLLIHLRELGHVDFYLGMLRLKQDFDLIFPRFNDQEIIIEQAKNLLIEKNVPNDLLLDPDHKNLLIIGSNASGKSVYLKTVGQLIYLAHCGFPIAAKFANICILQNMTTYFCGQMDGIFTNQQEFQYLKRHINKFPLNNSLFLVDEIAKYQKLQVSQAIQNALLEYSNKLRGRKRQPFLLMVSHIQDYLKLDDTRVAEMECLYKQGCLMTSTQQYTYQLKIKSEYQSYFEQNIYQAYKMNKNKRLYNLAKQHQTTQEGNKQRLLSVIEFGQNRLSNQIQQSLRSLQSQQSQQQNKSEQLEQQQSEQSQQSFYTQQSGQSQGSEQSQDNKQSQNQSQFNSQDEEEEELLQKDLEKLQNLVEEQMRRNRNSYNDMTLSQLQVIKEINNKAQLIRQNRDDLSSSNDSLEQTRKSKKYMKKQQWSESSQSQEKFTQNQKMHLSSQPNQSSHERIERMARLSNEETNSYAVSQLDDYQEQRLTFIPQNVSVNKIKIRQSQIFVKKQS